MRYSTDLPASAQAAYAEALEGARRRELDRSVGNLAGSFNRKVVKGIDYWYYQFTDAAGGKLRQIFIGRDDERIRALVERSRLRDAPAVERLAKSAVALGCAPTTPSHFRVVRRLNEIGFFQAGGVLVGTHAFLAFGNELGVSWGSVAQTMDLDFAHAGTNVQLALPSDLRIDTRGAVERLEAGLLPVPGLRPGERTATFTSRVDKHLRVDFLTPMRGGREEVFEHKALGVNLQPLPFLEFVLEDVHQAAVLGALGAVVVNVPDPARFALHKLLVFAQRRTQDPSKALKDLRQAAALLEVLARFREDDVLGLWHRDLRMRGPGWVKRADAALKPLAGLLPELPLVDAMKGAPSGARTKRKR
jgi:hypothetical protein